MCGQYVILEIPLKFPHKISHLFAELFSGLVSWNVASPSKEPALNDNFVIF